MPKRRNTRAQLACGQIVGERERQEDAFATADFRGETNVLALVLADGMGGHAGGEVASNLATKAFLAHLEAAPEPRWKALKTALFAANDSIGRAVAADPALDSMGCTLVAVTIAAGRLRWISVGDSPLFLLRGGHLSRLNADHSMRSVFADLVADGRLSAEEAANAPTRNALRSTVSGDEIDMIDAPDSDMPLENGDMVLLVSDGMQTLGEPEIAHMAALAMAGGAQRVVNDLLAAVAAKKERHQDNASAVVYLHGRRTPAAAFGPGGWRLSVLLISIAVLVLGAVAGVLEWRRVFPPAPTIEDRATLAIDAKSRPAKNHPPRATRPTPVTVPPHAAEPIISRPAPSEASERPIPPAAEPVATPQPAPSAAASPPSPPANKNDHAPHAP